jgi:hypothetical protein
LSGDADKQKGFCSIIRRLTIGSIAIKGFDLIPEGTEFLLQSPSPLRARGSLSRRPIGAEKISPFGRLRAVSLVERLSDLRDSAVKPGFEGVEF